MVSNPGQVIVTIEDPPSVRVHGVAVHHRNFPEARGEGESPESATARLSEMLSLALDRVSSGWKRELIKQAIEDVRAFAQRPPKPSPQC